MPIYRHGFIVTTIRYRPQSPRLLNGNPFAFRHLARESQTVNRLERSMPCSRADKGIAAAQGIAILDRRKGTEDSMIVQIQRMARQTGTAAKRTRHTEAGGDER
jgi:hypothetical protein